MILKKLKKIGFWLFIASLALALVGIILIVINSQLNRYVAQNVYTNEIVHYIYNLKTNTYRIRETGEIFMGYGEFGLKYQIINYSNNLLTVVGSCLCAPCAVMLSFHLGQYLGKYYKSLN